MRAQSRIGLAAILFLSVLVSFATSANSARLTVLNETLDPANNAATTFELYLSRLGTYYAELYLEHAGEPAPPAVPVYMRLSLAFERAGEIVYTRDVDVKFAAGQPVTTLLTLDIPRDLPQRKALDLVVTVRDIDAGLTQPEDSLRLQLTRKVQLLPLGR